MFRATLSTLSPKSRVHHLRDLTVSYTWLRDSCHCPQCVHPSTSQKLHRSPDMLRLDRSTAVKELRNDNGWHVTWKDGHNSFYPTSFLERYALRNPDRLAKFHHQIPVQRWTKHTLQNAPSLFVTYSSLSTPRGLVTAIEQISKYGILFITGVPNDKTSSEECETRVLASKFGEIRPTFYGLLWDVINKRDSKNIAYTNLHLDLHMDLLYFEHPPRYQILHCLRNRVIGGTSIFVDAIKAAETLRERSPESFALLATTQVPFHYINDGHHLYHTHPTIELDPTLSSPAPVKYVNYSPPFQAPFQLAQPPEQTDRFYASLREYQDLLDAKDNRYEYTLKEGDAVFFDNRRVLHARTAFEEIPGLVLKEGDVSRWLKGCYLEDDAMMDQYRVTKGQIDCGEI